MRLSLEVFYSGAQSSNWDENFVFWLEQVSAFPSWFIHNKNYSFELCLCELMLPKDLQFNRKPLKGIVSRDWKGLQMVSLDRFEV
jgi:hypothetical protein